MSAPFAELARLQRVVEFSLSHADDVHRTLRPVLREVATHRLARRGVSLDADPELAVDLLGPDLFDLVRADRPPPEHPFAPGLRKRELSAALDRLEGL